MYSEWNKYDNWKNMAQKKTILIRFFHKDRQYSSQIQYKEKSKQKKKEYQSNRTGRLALPKKRRHARSHIKRRRRRSMHWKYLCAVVRKRNTCCCCCCRYCCCCCCCSHRSQFEQVRRRSLQAKLLLCITSLTRSIVCVAKPTTLVLLLYLDLSHS